MSQYELVISVRGEEVGVSQVAGQISDLSSAAGRAGGPLSGLTGILGNVGKAAMTVAGGGLLAIGGGLTAAIGAGLSFNNSMEQVSAQLMAFTKDGAQTAAILDMIKERAASTPFAFEDMATAATALLPASKAAGVGLEELIAQAEILAASNPAEGLEGAAFALKEATGGDFQSAIERFNLPRQYINQLKEEGVPNLEILSRAMGQLGLDADLVSGLANTASGRWSTFLDTLTNVAATVSQPIFDAFSSGLAGVQTVLDANMPAIQAFAEALGGQITVAIQWLAETGLPMLSAGWGALQPALAAAGDLLGGIATIIQDTIASFQDGGLLAALETLGSGIVDWIAQQAPIFVAQIAEWATAFIGWITDITPQVVSGLLDLASAIGGWIAEQVPGFAAQLGEWAVAFVSWLPGAIAQLLGALAGVAGAIISWIVENGPTILGKLAEWGVGFGTWVATTAIPALLGALADLASKFGAWISENGPTILAKLAEWGAAFGTWVSETAVPKLMAGLAALWEKLSAWVAEVSPKVAAKVAEWAKAFVEWAKDVAPKIPGALAGILTAISAWATGALSKLTEQAAGLGKAIVDGIIKGVKAAGGALLDAMKSMATSALNAAKAALGIASPSRVMAAEVGAPIVDGIVQGLVQRSPKAVQAMLDLASSMFDVVSKGVEAFGKLTQLGNIPQSAIANFGDAIMRTLTEFSGKVGQWDKAAMSAASQFVFKAGQVVEFLTKGVELLNGIAALAVPSQDAIRAFADSLAMVMSEIVRVSTFELRLGLTAAVEFASAAGAIVEVIKKAVEALNSLSDFVRPAPGVIQTFVDVLTWLVSRFVLVAQWFDGQALGAAAAFAASAKQIVEVVGVAVDGLLKLGEFVRPAPGVIQTFADTLGWLVSRFVVVGGWFSGPALAAAGAFADSAGKVVGVIASAVDGLLKLGEFVRPAPGVIEVFTGVVWWLVSRFAEAASWMGTKALAAASAFAEGAGKAVGMIGGAVDALGKLSTFVAPAEANVSAFLRSMADLLEKMGSMAYYFEQDMLEATAVLAEGIQKSVAGLGAAVDLLSKLVTFVAPAEANVSAFLRGLADLLEKMGSMAYYFEQDMLAATAALADGIGKSVAGLGAAVDVLGKLVEFVAPAEANVSAFLRGLADLLEKMGTMAYYFEADMLATTGALAEGIGKSVAGLGAAIDALSKLVEFTAPAEANVSAFFRALADLLEKMGTMSVNFEADMLEVTGAFAAGIQRSVAGIGAAADALGKLVDFEAPAGKHVSAFFSALANLLTQMQQHAANFDVGLFEVTTAFASGVNTSVAPLKGAIDALGGFADFVPPAQKGVNAFFQSVAALLTTMGTLAAQYSAEFFAGTILFGQNVAKAVETIKEAFGLMAGLADLKGIASGVLTKFTETLAGLLAELERQVAPGAYNVGQQLALGIANGISSGTPAIVNAVYAAINQAILAAKAALGIASPSKVFQQQIGLQMAAGMAGGMAMGAPLVDRAVTDVSGRATAAVGGSSTTTTTSIGGITVNAAPGQSPEQIARATIAEIERRTGRRF